MTTDALTADALPSPIPYRLANEIRLGIITGRYRMGEALREQGLEKEYGSSRGPIREALRLLELRGFTVHEPRRGFRVRTYPSRMIRQNYVLRAMLERHAIDGLAGSDLQPLVEALREANDAMKVRRAGHDIAGYLEANIEFHNAILLHIDNEPLRRSLEVANEIAQPLRYRVLTQSLGDSPSIAEHERIIELIAANNLPAAAAMMEYHIMNGLDASLRAATVLGIGEEEQA